MTTTTTTMTTDQLTAQTLRLDGIRRAMPGQIADLLRGYFDLLDPAGVGMQTKTIFAAYHADSPAGIRAAIELASGDSWQPGDSCVGFGKAIAAYEGTTSAAGFVLRKRSTGWRFEPIR